VAKQSGRPLPRPPSTTVRPSLRNSVLDLRFADHMLERLKRRLFWVIARTCITLYGWFPLFGTLRASIGIIRRGQTFLVIQRSDGRGVSLPGGLAGWREADEDTLRREVLEETGLSVTGGKLRLRYGSTADVPCSISVFEVEASGDLKNSWEGSPQWMTASELEPRLLQSQRPVLELMKKSAAEVPPDGGADKEEDQK
jgi:8-oxo-dGTP pyrophosphatase MutT (NUDIX family)